MDIGDYGFDVSGILHGSFGIFLTKLFHLFFQVFLKLFFLLAEHKSLMFQLENLQLIIGNKLTLKLLCFILWILLLSFKDYFLCFVQFGW